MACQHVTSAIQFFHSLQGYFSINYVDDFGGCDTPERAADSFHALQHSFHFLGIDSTTEKDCPPSTFMVFLGILFNTVTMTMSIPQEKLSELLQLIQHISHTNHITRPSLQSLLGLMSYVTACVRPARIFMAALLNGLCGLPHHATLLITDDIRADLEWWLHFLLKYNGISIIPPIVYDPQIVVTDSCHTGGGGHFGYECFHVDFAPHLITDSAYDINVKEILTVIVAVCLWGSQLHGSHILLHSDNTTNVQSLNTRRPHSPLIQQCLQVLWFLCASHDLDITARHIPGYLNDLADLLSCWSIDKQAQEKFFALTDAHKYIFRDCPAHVFDLSFDPSVSP